MAQSEIMQTTSNKAKASASKSVLFIGFVWPELTATAASQNILSYVRTFLKYDYTVHFASAAQTSELSTSLAHHNVQCHAVTLNDDSFDELVKKLMPSMVIFDRFLTEEQFGWRVMRAAPDALRVLDCEDLHFLRHARHEHYKALGYQATSPEYLVPEAVLQQNMASTLHSDVCLREIACIHRCDVVLLLSKFEAQVLESTFFVEKTKILHIPYLIDNELGKKLRSNDEQPANEALDLRNSQQDIPECIPERKHFVSIGNFRHAPNIDAVNILVQQLWPSIRKALPEAECHVYGAYMPPRIKAYERPSIGLFMHGHVDDHFSALTSAKVLLAPIQFGAGVKGKLIDAFRCGLPSVTTPIGAEGIEHKHWPGAIVADKQAFIQSAIALYTANSSEYQHHQATMQNLLKTHFNTSMNEQVLINRLEYALAQIESLRQDNFLQKLVSHHSLKTHQYMSQWIAAKNKNRE